MLRPKTAAEILAAAKPAPTKTRRKRAQTESVIPNIPYSSQISTFSSTEPTVEASSFGVSSQVQPWFHAGSAHPVSNLQFKPPITRDSYERTQQPGSDANEENAGGEENRENFDMFGFFFLFLLVSNIFCSAFHIRKCL